jgi:hypothetical protein
MEKVIEISPQDVSFLSISNIDDVGRVFSWQGRLLRAIHQDHIAEIEGLLSSGLLQEMIAAGLMPDVQRTVYQLPGYALVLEHELVPVVTYPFEWSFNMLKDAAIVMLRVNQIARYYGYQTKDAHGYNILFHGSRPIFIDLGSLIKLQPGHSGWQGYEEFLQFFYYPLRLWSDGNEFLARRILSGAMQPLMPHESYLAYQYPPLRLAKLRLRQHLARFPLLLKRITSMPKEEVAQIWPGRKGAILKWLRPFAVWGGATLDLQALITKVQRLQLKDSESMWGFYQEESGLVGESGDLRPSTRFQRIADLVDHFQLQHVIELAGNQGVLSRYLLSETQVQSVICTDIDGNSIDSLYRSIGSEQQVLTPAVLDFMSPALLAQTRPPEQRMKAEAVLALAVTHHLLLSQKYSIDQILATICQYAERYIFVEFMPLGLYNGRSDVEIPDWYHLTWFREACGRHFQILFEEQLEENRILFVGRLGKP